MADKRLQRIDEEIKRALAGIIREDVKDDRVSFMVSVTKVDVTSDLKYAKVYVSVYDTDKNKSASIDGLNHAAPFIRTRLASEVDIRRVPELAFILDDSVEYSLKISQMLNEMNRGGSGNEANH